LLVVSASVVIHVVVVLAIVQPGYENYLWGEDYVLICNTSSIVVSTRYLRLLLLSVYLLLLLLLLLLRLLLRDLFPSDYLLLFGRRLVILLLLLRIRFLLLISRLSSFAGSLRLRILQPQYK